jgi:hypothetical protein
MIGGTVKRPFGHRVALVRLSRCRIDSDRLIFREEQRAIGESMIIGGTTRVVMGYAAFRDLIERADADDQLWWLRVAQGFFTDPTATRDFRRKRLELMRDHLDASIKLLD